MDSNVHETLMRDGSKETRAQNLRDAMVLVENIKNHETPDFAVIWADLTDAQVDAEVQTLAHVNEWLNLS